MIETVMFGLVLIALTIVILWVFLNGNLGPRDANRGILAMRGYGESVQSSGTTPTGGQNSGQRATGRGKQPRQAPAMPTHEQNRPGRVRPSSPRRFMSSAVPDRRRSR
jgi:hypothetical protein